MSGAIRVVHLPARTPYVRKITSIEICLLNGTPTSHGVVPQSVSAAWLLQRRPFDWFDVLHLHHVEFEDPDEFERLLSACEDEGINIVYTAHDVEPMFLATEDFQSRMNLIASSGAQWIGLTHSSVASLRRVVNGIARIEVIPHGYVVPPDGVERIRQTRTTSGVCYLMHGALRPNRDFLASVTNWTLSEQSPAARLDLRLRPFSPVDFRRYDVASLLAATRADTRVSVSVASYASDSEIAAAGAASDVLLLPYLYGTHSGQLEFAFDLNLVSVCADVGHLGEQYRVHSGHVAEPVWFGWGDGRNFLYGERYVRALEIVREMLQGAPKRAPDPAFLDYRREEHRQFLKAHRTVYAR